VRPLNLHYFHSRPRTQYLDTFGVSKGNVASKVQAFEYQSDEFSNSDKSRKNVSPVQSKSSQESITSQHSFPKRSVSSRAASNTRVHESKSNRQETDNLLSRLRQVTPPIAPQPLKNKLNTSDLDVKVPLDDPLGMNETLTMSFGVIMIY
jgi:hypothetical protein